jgi:hypothetical protein
MGKQVNLCARDKHHFSSPVVTSRAPGEAGRALYGINWPIAELPFSINMMPKQTTEVDGRHADTPIAVHVDR